MPGLVVERPAIEGLTNGVVKTELEHITDGYHPLALLLSRSAQVCAESLRDLVKRDPSRLRWLEFANTQREHFLKLFVLLQWGCTSRLPIGKLVDLVAWMREREATEGAIHEALGYFKREMAAVKVPNPDMHTALDILSTGASSRFPDVRLCFTANELGYKVQPQTTPSQLLSRLRDIDMLLHIRLNLYEDLPLPLQNFTIASGRVTFTIPGEFEMDLSLLGDEPDSRFYLVDFRFLFSQEIPAGQLRLEMEMRVNAVLTSFGLTGCYEFLLEYVLTFKLTELWTQARELAREAWSGNLKIERVHRSVVIEYWTSRPGKCWIEIGIEKVDRPRLAATWAIGKQREKLKIDDLDVRRLLEHVVQQHSWRILGKQELRVPLHSGEAVVQIEPITGRYAISPVNNTTRRTEEIFDSLSDPVANLPSKVLLWRTQDAAVTFQSQALAHGWEIVRTQLDATAKRSVFGDADASVSFIRRWQSSDWLVAAAPTSSDFDVFILEVRPGAIADVLNASKVENKDFDQLEEETIAQISAICMERRLRTLKIDHVLEQDAVKLPLLTITHHGRSGQDVVHMATGALKSTLRIKSGDIAIQNNTFTVVDRSQLASDRVVDRLMAKSDNIHRLDAFHKALEAESFRIDRLDLDSVTFVYDMYSATVSWSDRCIASFGRTNPHRRIAPLLRWAGPGMSAALCTLPRLLVATLPLLQAFDQAESRGGVTIFVHTVQMYSMVFKRGRCTLRVSFQHRNGQRWWRIQRDPSQTTSQQLVAALHGLFTAKNEPGVVYTKHGAAADLVHVKDLIARIVEVVRGCEEEPERLTNGIQTKRPPRRNQKAAEVVVLD